MPLFCRERNIYFGWSETCSAPSRPRPPAVRVSLSCRAAAVPPAAAAPVARRADFLLSIRCFSV